MVLSHLDDDLPQSEITVSNVIDRTKEKAMEVIALLRGVAPVDKKTSQTLGTEVNKLYALFRAASEITDALQDRAETLDALYHERKEYEGDLGKALEKTISEAFVLQNLGHEAIVQYLVEEKAKQPAELKIIIEGLSEEAKKELREILL